MREVIGGAAVAVGLLVAGCASRASAPPIQIIAGVDGNGRCSATWNGKPLSPDMIAELKRAARRGAVHIVGDRTVPYKCIGGAIYTMQAAGIAKIGFISEPPPTRVVLTVPRGPCAAVVDGRRMTMAELRPVADQWVKQDAEIHFQPDPHASYKCVDAALQILKNANWGKVGFIGNEAYDPALDDDK